MKANDLVVIGLAATLTAGAASLVWPAGRTASADPQTVLAPVQQAPAIEHEGAVFKLVPEGAQFETGQIPTYRLQVTDLAGQARRIPVKLALASQSPASKMSRVVSMPLQRWSDELLVGVVPGRTRSIRIQPDVALEAGQQVILTMQVGDRKPQVARLVLAPRSAEGEQRAPLAALQQQRRNR